MRLTTRVCHSKSIVESGERQAQTKRPYIKKRQKFDLLPEISRKLHYELEIKLEALKRYSNNCKFNIIEYIDKRIGVVAAGISYQYAKEVFGDRASYLKVGFSNPMPLDKIREFAKEVETLYVIEELEPDMEEQIRLDPAFPVLVRASFLSAASSILGSSPGRFWASKSQR